MSKKKHNKFKKPEPAHKRIPPEHGLLTHSAQALYDKIDSWDLRGCYVGNKKLAKQLDYSVRTITRARKELEERHVIIKAPTDPHTWMMWARYHRAVQNCPVLLYLKTRKMNNPFYSPKQESLGGQNVQGGGRQNVH